MVDIIRPTVHGILDPTVSNPERAYNGNDADRATLVEGTAAETAELYFALFEVGPIDPGNRLSVVLSLLGRFNSAAIFPDTFSIYFRVSRFDPFLLIDTQRVAEGFWPQQPSAQIWRTFDLTIPAGITPNNKFELLLQFFNDSGAGTEPPLPAEPP
jgi:hypothetical protein